MADMTPDLLERYARDYAESAGVNPDLVGAIMQSESAGRADAVSSKGAIGLMQVMPDTAKLYGATPEDLQNPIRNIETGVKHLAMLQQKFAGDLPSMVAAYNAGEGRVQKGGSLPAETQEYLGRVFDQVPHLLAPPSPAGPGEAQAAVSPSGKQAPTGNEPPTGSPAAGFAAHTGGSNGFLANLPQSLAAGAVDPLETLLSAPVAAMGGGPMPSGLELASAGLNVASIAVPTASRLGAAVLQGGAALATALADHQAPGETLLDTAGRMGPQDAAMIGGAVLLGAVLPGTKSAIGEAEKTLGVFRPGLPALSPKLQAERVVAQNKKLAAATISKFTDMPVHAGESPLAVLSAYPAAQTAAKNAAYAKIDRAAEVDVTDYMNALLEHKANGGVVPRSMQIGLRNVKDETGVATIGGMMQVIQPTGRKRATVGDLLAMNMKLGEKINDVAKVKGPTRDLVALRAQLTDLTEQAIGRSGGAKQVTVWRAALNTAKETKHNNTFIEYIGTHMDPESGVLRGKDMRSKLALDQVDLVKRFGKENFTQLKEWTTLMQRIEADPAKGEQWRQILQWASGGGRTALAGAALSGAIGGGTAMLGGSPYATGFAAAGAAATSHLVLRRMISATKLTSALEKFAATPAGSAQYAIRAGRVAAITAAIHAEVASQMGDTPEDEPSTMPPPPSMLPRRVPAR